MVLHWLLLLVTLSEPAKTFSGAVDIVPTQVPASFGAAVVDEMEYLRKFS